MRPPADRPTPHGPTFSRRAAVLGAAGTAAFLGLGARMYQLQVLQQAEYATLSDDNRFYHQLSPPSRGRILDRYGAVIAGNVENYQVFAIPAELGDVTVAAAAILTVLSPTGTVRREARDALAARLARGRRFNKFKPVLVADNLDWESFARINFHQTNLPGVIARVGETRAYGLETAGGARRDADAFAHVVGYVSKPPARIIDVRVEAARDEAEIRRLNRELRHPAARVGRAGLELTLDDRVSGQWGELRVEMDARGRVVREVGHDRDPQAGASVSLTLDAEVQAYAQQRLYGESGGVVAMDVHSGEVLCLVSAPAFDPNLFTAGISRRAYAALRNDERAPLYNKPLAGLYAPGSAFKMITAMAALKAGVITPEETITCRGSVRLGRRTFHCWKRGGHGPMDMRNGLKRSCDVYYYELAKRLYRDDPEGDPIAEMANLFGLGLDPYDIAVPDSRAGLVPTETWKRARHAEPMTLGDRYNSAIGQGYVLTSPIQLAVMTAMLANGGRFVKPVTLLDDVPADPEAALGPPVGDPKHIALMQDAMLSVVEEWGGTAHYSLGAVGLDLPGILMAGKTGTSQVRRITMEERARGVTKNEDLPWRRRDHAVFVGYAPYHAPRYSIAVVVEHGGSGSKAAAPVARDILRRLLERDPSMPAETAARVAPDIAPAEDLG